MICTSTGAHDARLCSSILPHWPKCLERRYIDRGAHCLPQLSDEYGWADELIRRSNKPHKALFRKFVLSCMEPYPRRSCDGAVNVCLEDRLACQRYSTQDSGIWIQEQSLSSQERQFENKARSLQRCLRPWSTV